MRAFTVVLPFLLVVPLTALSAQQPPPVVVGERVRITHHCNPKSADSTYPGCPRDSGTFVKLAADSVILRVSDKGDTLAVPLELVNRVEVLWGEKRNIIEGALWGLLGGAILGMAGDATCSDPFCGGDFALIAAGVFGAGGFAIGGTIGAYVKSDVWEEVLLSRLHVSHVPVQPGTRARVTAPDCGLRRQATTVETVHGDTLVFASAPSRNSIPINCPMASVARLEVSTGRRPQTVRVAGIGLLAGAAVGVPMGFAYANDDGCAGLSKWACAPLGAGILGASGALIGALVGSQIQSDHWKEIPLDQFRVSIGPQQEGLALGLSFAF
jgi:hypothetical protein